MRFIGGEDRALLRSNPSARSDAGTGTGASSLTMLPSTPACSGHKAPNLGGPGAAPPRPSKRRAVCHLATSDEAYALEARASYVSLSPMKHQQPAWTR